LRVSDVSRTYLNRQSRRESDAETHRAGLDHRRQSGGPFFHKVRTGWHRPWIWQCSEGKFNWYHDFDETILENDTMRPTRYGPDDVIFFKDGAHAKWHAMPTGKRQPASLLGSG
jgi:uncharacterized cupin superfamily protein